MARNEELKFTITSEDKASKDIDKVADKADDLEKRDVQVEVTSETDKAVDGIDEVTDSAKALMDRNPWVAEVLSDTAAAKSDLESLQGKLKETGDKADDTARHIDKMGSSEGPRLAGNQIADLTGPFGEASSAASDFGGVFDGLADISEKVAAKIGLNAAAMASAISGIGFVVAGAAAAWGIWKQKQDEAKKKAQEHLKVQTELNDALKDGNKEVASAKFIELYSKIIDLGHKAGLSTNEIVDSIRGVGDAAPDATSKLADLQTKIDDLNAARDELAKKTTTPNWAQELTNLSLQIDQLEKQKDGLKGAADEYAKLTDKQRASVDLQDDVARALDDTTGSLHNQADAADEAKRKADDLAQGMSDLRAEMDIERAAQDFEDDFTTAMNNIALGIAVTRDEVRNLEDDVVRAGEQLGKTPLEIRTELQKVDSGQLAEVRNDVSGWYAAHPVEIAMKAVLTNQQQIQSVIDKMSNPFRPSDNSAAPAGKSLTTINVNLPRGARHGDIARAMSTATRRNGTRYGRPTVHYARR